MEMNENDFFEPTKPSCNGVIHVVKEGDTLYKIAQMHKVSVLDLFLANPYVNVYNLQVADEICVPIKAVPIKNDAEPYIVSTSDNLEFILKTTGMSFDELAAKNPFLLQLKLPEKTVLFIPVKK